MELYIRSQDKMALVRAGDIYIKCDCYTDGKYFTVQNDNFNLGRYKTEERALEVLDEIQYVLKPRNLIYTGDKIHAKDAMHLLEMTNSESISMLPENANITQLGVLVYEMPKE